MLYSKDIRKICAYCVHAQGFSAEYELCMRLGPVTPGFTCKRFVYDPLRRTPPRPVRLKKPDENVFKL